MAVPHQHQHEHHEHAGHDHHDHHHDLRSTPLRALVFVLSLSLVIFVAEVIAGLWSGSLALLADAAHVLSDSAGLIVAGAAILVGQKQATRLATYGYKRIEVMAALANAVAVLAISGWIVVSAARRLAAPAEVATGGMMVVAVIGLLANVVAAFVLLRHSEHNLNLRGAYLHVLGDLLGSVAVIVAGLLIWLTGWSWWDPVASLMIALILVPQAVRLLRQTVGVLMEQVPQGIDVRVVAAELKNIPGVVEVHDLHVWSLEGTRNMATAHVAVVEQVDPCEILDVAEELLQANGISHSTIQIESAVHAQHEAACGSDSH